MKKLILTFTVSLFMLIILTSSCRLDGDAPLPAGFKSASYMVGSTAVTVTSSYDGIFVNNSITANSVILIGKDGSQITFQFDGTTAGFYPLTAYPDAVYKSPSSKLYNSVSGSLNITSYKVDGATNTFSATFSFVAASVTNPLDTIVINNGVITNCSNSL